VNAAPRELVVQAAANSEPPPAIDWRGDVLIANLSRGDLVKLLPKASCVAEIGTFRGGFASHIHRACKPEILHLIDPWGKEKEDPYVTSYRVTDDMEAMFQSVLTMFAGPIQSGAVRVHRNYSFEIADSFPAEYFDWIYVDGMHSYEAVLQDLKVYSPKVKSDGFIMGHDFSNTRMGRIKHFGVIRAVREFCDTSDFKLVLVTNEDAPSYMLVRDETSEVFKSFLSRLFKVPNIGLLEVDGRFFAHFEQVETQYAQGKRRQLFKFLYTAAESEAAKSRH